MKWELLLWMLASPVLLLKWIVQLAMRWRFWRVAYTTQLTCSNCQAAVSLVGLWRCHCGFTYRGHLLRVCPVCGSLPGMVRCYRCGVTQKLPEP